MKGTMGQISTILNKAQNSENLHREEIISLLRIRDQGELEQLFATARKIRNNFFDNKVFLYGFVYFSTWCKNACAFCAYRGANQQITRYRKTGPEIMQVVQELRDSGVHLVDLTMGEDPVFHAPGGFASLVKLIEEIKTNWELPVMVSPGLVSEQTLQQFAGAGTDWYACYQETFNEGLFKRLRLKQSFHKRLSSKHQARRAGLLIEEGLLLGVGEQTEDIADAILAMKGLGANQVRVMSFVPQAGSPMQDVMSPNRLQELVTIAVLRLVFPDKLIPASLDVDGIQGMAERLNSGANVVTSLIPAGSGLAGVAQHSKDIAGGLRTVAGIQPILQSLGLKAATRLEYTNWLQREKALGVPAVSFGG